MTSERELSWLGSSGARSLSADGRQLLMVDVGLRSGPSYGVVLRATDGSQPMRLGAGSAERLSPDGRWAAAIIASPPEVVLYPTGAGTPRRIDGGRFDPVSSVQWFPDSQRLLVCGTETGRLPRCYRSDLDGTSPSPRHRRRRARGARRRMGTTLLLTIAGRQRARGRRLGQPASRPIASLQAGRPRASAGAATAAQVYVQRGFEMPVRGRARGPRRPAHGRSPGPSRRAGVADPASVLVADWFDDGRAYAYNYTSVPSVLFVVSGACRTLQRTDRPLI